MKIKKQDIRRAVERRILSESQAEQLWEMLSEPGSGRSRFDVEHVAYYFGTIVVILAMTWLATEAFSQFSSFGLMLVAAAYFFLLWGVGHWLYRKQTTLIPGGLILTAAIFMVPLFVFSVQSHFGWWLGEEPGTYRQFFVWLHGGWFPMEITTILAAGAFLYSYRFPFMTLPLAFTLWFLSMDITPLIFGIEEYTRNQACTVSILFGLAMITSAAVIGRRSEKNVDYWLYLFGLMAFWGGITWINMSGEIAWFVYFCINMGLMAASLVLRQRVFIVFGAVGVYIYLYHLSYSVFEGSILFPVVLSLLGLSIVWLGILYKKHEKAWMDRIRHSLPARVSGYFDPEGDPVNRE